MKTLFLPAAFALIFSPILSAQDAPPAFQKDVEVDPFDPAPASAEPIHDHFDPYSTAPKNLRIQVEYIQVDHKTLTKLLMEEDSRKMDATALRMKVQKLIDKDEAAILETSVTTARSGEKSTAESIGEFIYPTEYDPTPACGQHSKEEQEERQAIKLIAPHLPTAFETRNTGSTLEVEPTLGEDDTLINIRFVPELVWHTGNTSWHEIKDSLGNVNKVEMPDFYTARLNLALTVINGQYTLAGVLSPKDDKGRFDPKHKLMVFLKINVLAAIK